jgi:fungal STAND N-terminal Goodbye domain
MSSTGQATPSSSTIQSIIDALADYTNVTGIDLSNNPFAAAIEHSNTPEAILEILQEREKAFKEYRGGNRRLINCLRPTVKVIHSFSGILGEAASLVSHTCHLAMDTLLVSSSGPVSTGKSFVCWHRYSSCCTSLECAFKPISL